MVSSFLTPQLVQAIGWTLLHALWQGAVFALALATLLIVLRSYTAQARYTVSVGLMAGFFLTVGATFYVQFQQQEPAALVAHFRENGQSATPESAIGDYAATPVLAEAEPAPISPVATTSSTSIATVFRDYYNRHLPLLVTLWLVGVLVLQLRFLGQLAFVQRLKHHGTSSFPTQYKQRLQALEEKLRIRRTVTYLLSRRAASPMVIGWFRPVVLVPQQLIDKLTETEIYAVLAHELAHVRREDFAINLLQTLLTNVFFFHPGVWWMSSRIDDEREHCCDDLAVAATGDALPYAKTLVSVSELHLSLRQNSTASGTRAAAHSSPALAMALSGKRKQRDRGGFAGRVKRLFSSNAGVGTYREGFATACILFGALGMGLALSGQTTAASLTEASQSDVDSDGDTLVYRASPELKLALNGIDEIKPIDGLDGLDGLDALDLPDAGLNLTVNTAISNVSAASPGDSLLDALVRACYEGDLARVMRLVESGANVNGTLGSNANGDAFTPLIAAAGENEVAIVKYLLDKGADVNATASGWTALIEAADENAYEVMQVLLDRGANVDYSAGPKAPTAATMAANEGHLRCLQLLADAGANLNGVGEGITPLMMAANEGKADVVHYLIGQGVNVNKADDQGRTALMYAASEGEPGVVTLLIDAGADVNIHDAADRTAATYAMAEEEYETARLLGADVDDYSAEWEHIKAERAEWNAERLQFEAERVAFEAKTEGAAGLDSNALNRLVEAALEYVEYPEDEQERHEWTQNILAEHANAVELEHEVAMQRAERNMRHAEQNYEHAQRDMERHQNEAMREGAATPLMAAVMQGELAEVRALVQNGADVNHKDANGGTPLHLGVQRGSAPIVDYLLQQGASVDATWSFSITTRQPKDGVTSWSVQDATPLFLAVHDERLELVKLLLAAGADPLHRCAKQEERRNSDGERNTKKYADWSPLEEAQQRGNAAIISLLK